MKTPRDPPFNCRGDGASDDSIGLQKWLDAIKSNAGSLPPGVYLSSKTLKVHSHTSIHGSGGEVSVIKAHPLLLANETDTQNQLLTNAVVTGDLATRTDGAINFYGVGFQRSATKRTAASMLGFAGVSGITFRDCTLAHARRFLSAFSACSDVTFDNCDLYDWGSLDPVLQPGACLHDGGYAIWGGADTNSGFTITNCRIRDGQWTAIHATGERWSVVNTEILRVHEAGIFGGPTRSRIVGCRIVGVRRRDCSAAGMEIGGRDNEISGNLIGDCDYNNLLISNPINYIIARNRLFDPMQLASAAAPAGACIGVRNHHELSQKLDNLSLCDNTMWCTTGKAAHAIELQNQDMGPFDNTCVLGNNLGSKEQWKGEPILIGPNVRGKNFIMHDNTGAGP